MFPIRSSRSLLVVTVVLLGASLDVCAQEKRDPRAARPFRGLFGANHPASENGQMLDLTFSLFAGYDDDISGRNPGSGKSGSATVIGTYQRNLGLSSTYAAASANLRYRRNVVNRLSLEASAGTSSGVYDDAGNLVATDAYTGIGLNWTISPKTRLRLSQNVAYSPFYTFTEFPAAGVDVPLVVPQTPSDLRLNKQDNLRLSTVGEITRTLSSRASLYAGGQYHRMDFFGADYRPDAADYGAGAGVAYTLTRHARARLGYSYRTRTYDGAVDDDLTFHSFDAGVDYSRSLAFSLTRRTQLSFSAGSAFTSSRRAGRRFFVVGNANLSHRMGRTWAANLSYARNLQIVNGFSDAFFYDVVVAQVGGYVGQRVLLQSSAGTNWGQFGLSRDDGYNRRTRTNYLSEQVQVALTQKMALQGTYFFYRYAFDSGAVMLPEGIEPRNKRQGVRVGLVVWLPLTR